MSILDNQNEVLITIQKQLARIETKLESFDKVSDIASDARDTAREAMQYAKSAHHRIEDLKNDDIKELKDNQTWLWRTAIASFVAGLTAATGVLSVLIKLKTG